MGGEIDEGEARVRRAGQAVAPADAVEIAERGAVAGQQQMVAVVDGDAEGGIVIGAAASAGLVGCLVDDGALAAGAEPHGGGKSGKPGTDDVE